MDEIKKELLDFDSMCRLCLAANVNLVPIFTWHKENNIPEKLATCSRIRIEPCDGLPGNICLGCITSLNAAYEFHKLCENSDRQLQSIMTQIEVKGEDITDEALQVADSDCILKNEDDHVEMERECDLSTFVKTSLRVRRSCARQQPVIDINDCGLCQKSFGSKHSLERHNSNIHGVQIEKKETLHSCEICDAKFSKKMALIEHEKELRHFGKAKCEYCFKVYSKSYITEHIQSSHLDGAQVLCNLCGKSFAHKSVYRKHIKLCQNPEKKLKCPHCDLKFHMHYALKEHERIHTNEKPYVCETCGKAFRRKMKLTTHQMCHTGVKPYVCPTCARSFRQSSHLVDHIRTHTGIKPFVCDTCDAAFTQGHSLKTHKEKHKK